MLNKRMQLKRVTNEGLWAVLSVLSDFVAKNGFLFAILFTFSTFLNDQIAKIQKSFKRNKLPFPSAHLTSGQVQSTFKRSFFEIKLSRCKGTKDLFAPSPLNALLTAT